jgi:TRAP-type uncharacterized transport system fused permease subunit
MDKETIEPKESGAISTRQRQLTGIPAQLVRLIAIGMSLFQLYTGYFQFTAMNQRVPHVCLGYILIFLVYPLGKKSRKDRLSIDSLRGSGRWGPWDWKYPCMNSSWEVFLSSF